MGSGRAVGTNSRYQCNASIPCFFTARVCAPTFSLKIICCDENHRVGAEAVHYAQAVWMYRWFGSIHTMANVWVYLGRLFGRYPTVVSYLFAKMVFVRLRHAPFPSCDCNKQDVHLENLYCTHGLVSIFEATPACSAIIDYECGVLS